jgi:hypothetical protein
MKRYILYATLRSVLAMAAFAPVVSAQPAVPRWRGTIDLTIGGDGATESAQFSRIVGIATDSSGRIFVGDAGDQQVRIFTVTGAPASRFGRKGAGPLEFKDMAAMTFGPGGYLWIRDEGNARMLAVDVSKPVAANARTFPLRSFTGGDRNPVTFDATGSLISETTAFDPVLNTFRPLRLRHDTAGNVARTDTLPIPPGAFAGQHKVTVDQKNAAGVSIGVAQFYIWQPNGPEWLRAYGARGMRADVVGSAYAVRVYDANGALLRTIRRDVAAVPLSARERTLGQARLDTMLARRKLSRSSVPFGVPATKPFIISVAFTLDGGLWVERSVPDGKPREADVYDASGKLIAIAEWPAAVSLHNGPVVISGTTLLTVLPDADDVPSVVRLRFR